MDKNNITLIPKKAAGIVQSDLVDGCMLLDRGKAIAYALNLTASLMWTQCDGQNTIGEIVAMIAESTDVSADHIKEDIAESIGNLHHHGLIDYV